MTALGLHDRDCNAPFTLGSSVTRHFYTLVMIIPPQTTMTVMFCFIQFAVKYLLRYSEDPIATLSIF
jgi:hypothetical protein